MQLCICCPIASVKPKPTRKKNAETFHFLSPNKLTPYVKTARLVFSLSIKKINRETVILVKHIQQLVFTLKQKGKGKIRVQGNILGQ